MPPLRLSVILLACWTLPALAQPGFDPTRELAQGALLFHGNYCGPGNRDLPPVDALDRACMRHDACSPPAGSGQLPRCGCNRRLSREAAAVARDPRQSAELRLSAKSVSDGARLLPCH